MLHSEDDYEDLGSSKRHQDIGPPKPVHAITAQKRKWAEDSGDLSTRAAKQKKLKSRSAALENDALDLQVGVNRAIAHMDSRLMADHLAQRTKRFRPELSIVEAEDVHVSERAIVDTTAWHEQRTTEKVADFLEHFAGDRRKKKEHGLANASKSLGSPHTLVVAGAGLRAADLTRALRRFQTKKSTVAKLFAKHIKLKDAVEMVKKTRMGIGVGTPQRIIDLLEDGALSSSDLERIIIDASHIDQKKRGILDMRETQVPLMQLLSRKELKDRYSSDGETKLELLFY